MLLDEFFSEVKERIESDFNETLESLEMDRVKEITEEFNFVDCSPLTMAVFPSVTNGETVSSTDGGMTVSTTIVFYVNDEYGTESNALTFRYFDAFISWFRINNPLFSSYDMIDNAVLLRMNENCDFNGFVIELKSRIYTEMDYT